MFAAGVFFLKKAGVFFSSRPGDFDVRGVLYALAGTLLVSTNFVTAKYALAGFNPETFSLLWLAAASFYAGLIVIVSGRARLLVPGARSWWKPMFLMGAVTGGGMLCGWTGLSLLDPSLAALIGRSGPVIAILLGVVFLNERFLKKEILPIALMIAGGFMTVAGRGELVALGVGLSFLGAAAVGLQHFIARKYAVRIHPDMITFYRVFLAGAVVGAWGLASGRLDFSAGASYWAVLFLGAFLGPCASHILTFRSYLFWGLSRTSLVSSLQPLFVLPLAYFFLGEFPGSRELGGGGLILLGSFWVGWIHMFGRKAPPGGPAGLKTEAERLNRRCAAFPCHEKLQDCTFCYCPFYPCLDERMGKYVVSGSTGGRIWSCEDCVWIHEKKVVDGMLDAIRKKGRGFFGRQ